MEIFSLLELQCHLLNYVRGHVKVNGLDAVISTGITKLNMPGTDLLFPPNINEIVVSKQKVLKKNGH